MDITFATYSLLSSFSLSIWRLTTYDLLFELWLRIEIERIINEIVTTLTAMDNESNVCVAELRELMGFINQSSFPFIEYIASSFRRLNSHGFY